jgi:hypothetical protein
VTQIDREWTFGSLAYAAHRLHMQHVRTASCIPAWVHIGRVKHNGRSVGRS